MIRTLLVANRGEIARRVFRTAALMGIRTVAVYSEGDRHMPHVAEADRAVALPGRDAAATYLDIEALLAAAVESGVDAVHPGYGFLSENAGFARAVIAAGLTWVGPPPEVIDAMGDKLAAKRLMEAAGVPVLPTWDPDGSAGDTIDFPVLVKATAGGGGKGMRVVSARDELPEAVAAARRESRAAFGDDRVFLERLVTSARHVEIQVLADDHGHTIHCFERECSIQRRHQKIIEEAPSPALAPDLRERMGSAAVAAARAVGYRSAGTVEFVLEPDGHFWFLEVNTRLQVEHPVTEAVTGLDLVREQLRIADGEPISVSPPDLAMVGHAIEVRLYAEDPANGFLPATGTLVDFRPAPAPAVRWDSGVETGSQVGVEFDPMLAKVISHAPTRAEAAGRLALALERSCIRGVRTNRDFLVNVLRSPEFLAGDTTTDFIGRVGPALDRSPSAGDRSLAATAACLALRHLSRLSTPVLRSLPAGWRNSVMPAERVELRSGESDLVVEYRSGRDGEVEFAIGDWSAVVTGAAAVATRAAGAGNGNRLDVFFEAEGQAHRFDVVVHGSRVYAQGPAGDLAFEVLPRFPAPAGAVPEGGLVAPMPGRVLTVDVESGQAVETGRLLMVIEAMKMEHRVTAPYDGRVAEIRAGAGDQVSGGDLLVVLEAAEGSAS
ncbi:MAG TPA: biotin carboxylase N-terminal domain-containing protein [Acidimicrobiales bacterium]|nr:biotin carboxylase N-terminal domain-containing protein [Acidimicrobiales bacterium]